MMEQPIEGGDGREGVGSYEVTAVGRPRERWAERCTTGRQIPLRTRSQATPESGPSAELGTILTGRGAFCIFSGNSNVNLRAMQTLAAELHLPVGYSDHVEGGLIAGCAGALDAVVIEKHLPLDRKMRAPITRPRERSMISPAW